MPNLGRTSSQRRQRPGPEPKGAKDQPPGSPCKPPEGVSRGGPGPIPAPDWEHYMQNANRNWKAQDSASRKYRFRKDKHLTDSVSARSLGCSTCKDELPVIYLETLRYFK